MTRLDQEVMDNLRLYDSSLLREPRWGEDFFGIDPFYVALGMNFFHNFCLRCQSEKEWETVVDVSSKGRCRRSADEANKKFILLITSNIKLINSLCLMIVVLY